MSFGYRTCFAVLAFIVSLQTTLACNGYTLKINHVRNCGKDNLMVMENPGGSLGKDCVLTFQGCLNITKGFKTAKGKYHITKSPMPPMEGEINFCEMVKSVDDAQISEFANLYNIPKSCPVAAMRVCASPTKTLDLSRFKHQLPIAIGVTDVKLELTHDTGKSCFEVNFTITRGSKPKRG